MLPTPRLLPLWQEAADAPAAHFRWSGVRAARGSARELRGGDWFLDASYLAASTPDGDDHPASEFVNVGFRVASLVPEPGRVCSG